MRLLLEKWRIKEGQFKEKTIQEYLETRFHTQHTHARIRRINATPHLEFEGYEVNLITSII